MTIVDARGRLFARVNVVDAAVALCALIVAGLALLGFAMFRQPATPRIDTVAPSIVTAGTDARVTVTGAELLPFFRVFLEPSRGATRVSHRIEPDEPSDEFTLSNEAQARLVVETPELGELWIPAGTLPGTYAIALYDETRRVAIKENAITVAPAAIGPPPQIASIRAFGVFTGLRAEAAKSFAVGTRFMSAEQPMGEILSVAPPSLSGLRLQVGNTFVTGSVEDRVLVPASLRLFCVAFDGRCQVGDTYVGAFTELTLPFHGETARFFIHEVTADVPAAAALTTVTVRFEAPPQVAALVKAGDRELFDVGRAPVEMPLATLMTVGPRREAAQQADVFFDAELQVPVVRTREALWFRGEALKAGKAFSFTTAEYTVNGTIVRVQRDDMQVPATK